LLTKPLGVSGVTNPRPATGGTDPDTDTALRSRAPLPTLAMDRLVGVRDYQDFALARAGIAKAAAAQLVAGGRELVHLTLAGVDDGAIDPDSDLLRGLLGATRRFGDPGVPVVVAARARWNLVLEARVGIEADRAAELVRPHAEAALRSALGFEARPLGEGVRLSAVLAALHGVPGVVFVDVLRFGATTDVTAADAAAVTGVPDLVRGRPARTADDGLSVEPADLVVAAVDLPGFVSLRFEVAAP
jgi:predicted phage baseplate assembly protein